VFQTLSFLSVDPPPLTPALSPLAALSHTIHNVPTIFRNAIDLNGVPAYPGRSCLQMLPAGERCRSHSFCYPACSFSPCLFLAVWFIFLRRRPVSPSRVLVRRRVQSARPTRAAQPRVQRERAAGAALPRPSPRQAETLHPGRPCCGSAARGRRLTCLGWAGAGTGRPWLSEVTRRPARAASPPLSPGKRGTLGKTLSAFPFKVLPELAWMERVLRLLATNHDFSRWFVAQEGGSHPPAAKPPFSSKPLGPLGPHGLAGE